MVHLSSFLATFQSFSIIYQNKDISKQKNQLKEWKDKYHSLKIANTFLGSDDKSLTKLKINNLIKELDENLSFVEILTDSLQN